LSGKEIAEVPAELATFSFIINLNLSVNHIKSFPDLGNRLQVLDISSNQLEEITEKNYYSTEFNCFKY